MNPVRLEVKLSFRANSYDFFRISNSRGFINRHLIVILQAILIILLLRIRVSSRLQDVVQARFAFIGVHRDAP